MKEIIRVKLKDIDNFKNHPFLVVQDDSLSQLSTSIKENGLLNPLIVRKKAMELIGLAEAEVIVENLNDDEATIYMVDSNMYREKILPSEKAFAYKMKQDAMKHQGKITSDPRGPKLTSEVIGKKFGDSSTNVKRYIRLTYLIPELLEIVYNLTMRLLPVVELSFLFKSEQ